jgi:hypothetical protein
MLLCGECTFACHFSCLDDLLQEITTWAGLCPHCIYHILDFYIQEVGPEILR